MSFMSIENSDINDYPSWSELLTVGQSVVLGPVSQNRAPSYPNVLLVLHTGQQPMEMGRIRKKLTNLKKNCRAQEDPCSTPHLIQPTTQKIIVYNNVVMGGFIILSILMAIPIPAKSICDSNTGSKIPLGRCVKLVQE